MSSIAHIALLADAPFKAGVSVCVLTEIQDYEAALQEMHRVLVPDGILAVTIVHPYFASPPGGGWECCPVDSARPEDRLYWRVQDYLRRTWETWHWEGVGTATGFHRPLLDYMQALLSPGFRLPTSSSLVLHQSW